MTPRQFSQIIVKIITTGLIAAAFVALFINAPFLSHLAKGQSERANAAMLYSHLDRAAPIVNTGSLSSSTLPTVQEPDMTGLPSAMGMFSGQFAQNGDTPSFTMKEVSVEGVCEGAGRRYITQNCPDCDVLEGSQNVGQPTMLLWTESGEHGEVVRSVTASCIAIGRDGRAVVGSLSFGDGAIDLTGDDHEMALTLVPLLPGGKRLTTLEMDGWLTTMDEVQDPEQALQAMTTALNRKGWIDAPGQLPDAIPGVGEQRVFRRDDQATCVIYLNEESGIFQLVTIMNSST